MQEHKQKKVRQTVLCRTFIILILTGGAVAIVAPRMAAIVTDELQTVKIAVVTAAGGTLKFHTLII